MSDRSSGPVAYTDGGCVGNPGPGGWGVHIEYPDGRVIELGGADLQTTNNRMELRAAIEAVRATLGWPSATIVTDSQYVLKGITGWVAGWKRKDWVTSTGQPVINRDLWEELDALANARLTWEWAKGHSGVPGNERCDEIASWFSGSVRPLAAPRARRPVASRADLPPTPATGAQASRQPRSGAPTPAVSTRPSRASGVLPYVSLVDGIVQRHATWGECEQRVKGVKSARYKKVRSAAEEQETFAKWGVTADDLFGI
jgi:ribonuclease HI